jgi:hypothetical protein
MRLGIGRAEKRAVNKEGVRNSLGQGSSRFEIAPRQLPAPEFLRARVRNLAEDRALWNAIRDAWTDPPSNALKLNIRFCFLQAKPDTCAQMMRD